MGLLLLMGGVSDPNPQSLFVNNELGLAIDIGDRNGASEAKRTWRRNLWTYSDEFSNAVWTKTRCSINPNVGNSPVGTGTADELIENTDNNTHILSRVASCDVATYTLSVYAKSDGRNWFSLMNGTLVGIVGHFDLNTGTVGTVGVSCTADMEDAGDGWWRCWITFTASSGSNEMRIRLGNADNSPTYLGDGASGILIDGFQLEQSATPSTYQPITDFNTEFKAAYPTHSLYVDSNGVAPAVYPGDQVGLVIDSSRGGLENLGPELVTNGGFDSDTWWSKGTGVTISGGLANYNTVALNNGVFRSGVVTAGKFYVVTFTVASFSSGGVRVYTGGNRTSTYAATGTYRVFCLAGSSDTQLIFEATSAGTVLTLDDISVKEIPGVHPYQTTSGSRPALCRTPDGGRRNLLTYSEQFDVTSGGWAKNAATITANSTTAPDGTTTADTITATAAFGNFNQVSSQSSTTFTMSIYAKKNGFDQIELGITNNNAYGHGFAARFDLTTGLYVSQRTFGTGYTLTGYSIADAGNGWYRITCSGTISVAAAPCGWAGLTASAVNGSTVFVWGAQLETGSSATTYQRVTTTHDVTESGKRDCWGLLADGSDDSLITSSVDFSSTDKMTVMAGVRKNSDSADAIVCELTASYSTNAGSFYLCAPEASAPLSYSSASRGTASSNSSFRAGFAAATGAAPDLAILSTTHDLSGDLTTLRRNGVAASNATGDKGSGNFANSAIYTFRRGGSTLYFPGILYTLIIRGAATPTGTIADFEKNLLRIRAGLGPF
jgi:hypothetical protein